MPTKTPWLNISDLLLNRASYFQIYSLIYELVSERKRKFIVREISVFMAIHVNFGLAPHSVKTDHEKAAGASSENYFLFRQNYRACKMRSNYAGVNLPSALCEENKNKISNQITSPMYLQNRSFKAGAHQMEPLSPLISWVNPFPRRFINRTTFFCNSWIAWMRLLPAVWTKTILLSFLSFHWLFPLLARETSSVNCSIYKSTRERVESNGLYGR